MCWLNFSSVIYVCVCVCSGGVFSLVSFFFFFLFFIFFCPPEVIISAFAIETRRVSFWVFSSLVVEKQIVPMGWSVFVSRSFMTLLLTLLFQCVFQDANNIWTIHSQIEYTTLSLSWVAMVAFYSFPVASERFNCSVTILRN